VTALSDDQKNVTQLITSMGYVCEQHWAQTTDGFLLSLQRIPRPGAPPVVLVHGLLDSAATWVMNPRNQSLAFILADAGYDVWLANNRGNVYSKRNIHYKPSQKEFWAWSWDEMGTYDLPGIVDYILATSGQAQVSWVGHSRGSQQAFAAFASPLTINDKIALAAKLHIFVAFAPIAYFANMQSPLAKFFAGFDTHNFLETLGFNEFLPAGSVLSEFVPELCWVWPRSCDDVSFLLFGCCDAANFNQSRLDVYYAHLPCGSSTQDMAHYSQLIAGGGYGMYDYGSAAENMKHYGVATAPAYNVSTIPSNLRIALFSGGNDILADPKDVALLQSLLPPGVLAYANVQPQYTHMDFTWGMNAARDIYPALLKLLPAAKGRRQLDKFAGRPRF